MAWKKVFDNENLLSPKEYKLAEKYIEKKAENHNALIFKRDLLFTTTKYNIYLGIKCSYEWDEFATYTEPQKYYFIVDKSTKKVIAFADKLFKDKDSIVRVLVTPFKFADIVCPVTTNENGIFNLKNETLCKVNGTFLRLQYDSNGNIYSEKDIKVKERTYYKNGVPQKPIYDGIEEITK